MAASSAAGNVLCIVRHGQSETNAAGIFTGLLDPPLTSVGEHEALAIGSLLKSKHIHFTIAFTSLLQRASRSLDLILSVMFPIPPAVEGEAGSGGEVVVDAARLPPPVERTADLNERDYGELNGLRKKDVAERYGDEQAQLWRRSYDAVPPGGESLEMTCVSLAMSGVIGELASVQLSASLQPARLQPNSRATWRTLRSLC